jgi:Asp-tRNA(Asn)/Glu-tRNA(Gln) amidotransferase A subunit family amidase
MTDLYRLGLIEVIRALGAHEFTSQDYTRALLTRIDALDADIGAWAWMDAEAALHKARASDAIGTATEAQCLRGIPLAIKDIIDTAGMPTECGTPVFHGRVPTNSAAAVRTLENAGGFVLGKTVTSELAYAAPGKTRNPWHPGHTPGGSSSGSAAAVAAGFAPAALGTQTNGSVIRPAAFCGVVGFKPSSGLISRAGIQPVSPTLDHVGIFARSAIDAAVLACCLAGFDPRDSAGLNAPQSACHPALSIPPLQEPPKLALVRTPVWDLATPAQQENLYRTADRLRQAGATVDEIELPSVLDDAHRLHRIIMFAEGARMLQPLRQEGRGHLSRGLNDLIEEGLAVSDDALAEALAARLEINRALHQVLREYEAFITPPATGEAPATLESTGDPAFCTIWTLAGVPAMTIPSGFGPNGLPLGVQIVGPYLKDDRVVAIAQWCEARIGLGPLIAEREEGKVLA